VSPNLTRMGAAPDQCAGAAPHDLELDSAILLLAQTKFGGPRPSAEPQVGAIVEGLMSKQSDLSRDVRNHSRPPSPTAQRLWTMLAISFAYAFFTPQERATAGGDLVLSGRQSGDREARIVLSFRPR